MDRRTFILLTGAASGAALAHPGRPSWGAPVQRPDGRLRFSLDDERRWSLWYQTAGAPVPLIEHAVLGAWIGDRLITLNNLEDTAVGTRRPPAGESLVVRGRAADLWLEAEFVTAPAAPAPRGAVTVTLYPDRALPTCRGIRFFDLPPDRLLSESTDLRALVTGPAAHDPCRLVDVSGAGNTTSYGALGLTRGVQGLAVAFDPGEPGVGQVALGPASLEARSLWQPARPLRPTGDRATIRLCYDPAGDGLSALTTLFRPTSAVDRERLIDLVAPTGWSFSGGLDATEAGFLAGVTACAERFDRRYFRYVVLGEGYQRAVGDWDTGAAFPSGHRALTDHVHAHGLRAGLWIAPFAVTAPSTIPATHPDWLLPGDAGPLIVAMRPEWGGAVYGLDGAHPQVQTWLYDVARRAAREWGYDCLVVDGLGWTPHPVAHRGGYTHAEASRRALAALRDGFGPAGFLLAAGGPLQQARGVANGARVGPDVTTSWGDIEHAARATALRSFYQRGAWINDPGPLLVGEPLSDSEARAWASVVALSGGTAVLTDDPASLPPARVALARRTLPAAPVSGRPVGALRAERVVAPAFLVGDAVIPAAGPWRFRTGDDPSYASRDYADDVWETVTVPGPWEEGRRPEYDGFAWYRSRVVLPARTGTRRARDTTAVLELGQIDDADETFVNGVRVGGRGGFPPSYHSARRAYRRYPVPAELVNWGGENVVAIRVFDGGGGGPWNPRRERPAGIWVAEGAPDWWTVALINWDDEPRELSASLAELGITAERLHAYDVWNGAPQPAVEERVAARVAPHDALVLSLRRRASHPQVIGTTRHVLQGAIDVAEEEWTGAQRTLRARATALDDAQYSVTVVTPGTHGVPACTSTRPCTVRRAGPEHVVVEWPPDAAAPDFEWELRFPAPPHP